MGHNTPMEQPRITPTLYWTNHDQRSMVNVDYCSCIECQVRLYSLTPPWRCTPQPLTLLMIQSDQESHFGRRGTRRQLQRRSFPHGNTRPHARSISRRHGVLHSHVSGSRRPLHSNNTRSSFSINCETGSPCQPINTRKRKEKYYVFKKTHCISSSKWGPLVVGT
jgi:hypothetical protein